MCVPLSLFAFCWIFTLSLYLSRFRIIVGGLFPLFVLFCLLEVWCTPLISIRHSASSFFLNSGCNFSYQSSHVSSGFTLEYHLLSGYFYLIYPLDLLSSLWHSLDQSDSNISLQFGVRYLLNYLEHCPLFLPVGSLWILCFFSNLLLIFELSSICCLVNEKIPLKRFDMFFFCWANWSLNIFPINSVICFFFCHLVVAIFVVTISLFLF